MLPAGRFRLGRVAAGAARGRRCRAASAMLRAPHVSRRARRADGRATAVVLIGAAPRRRSPCSLFCLFRPALILKAAVPQQNFLGVLVDDSRSMSIADRERPDAQRVHPAAAARARTRSCSTRCRSGSSSASSASPRRRTASRRPARPEVRRHVDAARDGARPRARRALGPAARRARDGDRRRRHLRRRDRRDAGQPEGAIDSGVHGRRRPGALRARRAGDARRDAAQRPQGHGAASSTSCCRRPATRGQTMPLSVEDDGRIVSTQEVTLPPDGESATVRVQLHAPPRPARARSGSRCRRSPASRSRRTTRATR